MAQSRAPNRARWAPGSGVRWHRGRVDSRTWALLDIVVGYTSSIGPSGSPHQRARRSRAGRPGAHLAPSSRASQHAILESAPGGPHGSPGRQGNEREGQVRRPAPLFREDCLNHHRALPNAEWSSCSAFPVWPRTRAALSSATHRDRSAIQSRRWVPGRSAIAPSSGRSNLVSASLTSAKSMSNRSGSRKPPASRATACGRLQICRPCAPSPRSHEAFVCPGRAVGNDQCSAHLQLLERGQEARKDTLVDVERVRPIWRCATFTVRSE